MQVSWLIQELKVLFTISDCPLLQYDYIKCYDLFSGHYANDNSIYGLKKI